MGKTRSSLLSPAFRQLALLLPLLLTGVNDCHAWHEEEDSTLTAPVIIGELFLRQTELRTDEEVVAEGMVANGSLDDVHATTILEVVRVSDGTAFGQPN